MAIGGQAAYPSLNDVMNLARSAVNDDKAGATGTPGEGQILTNTSVTALNFLNSAIREMYRDVRIMGQPTLIKDNYIVLGLPPVNSPLGAGAPNPAVQTALQFVGYFDGLQMWPNLTLPNDLILPMEVWERQNGTNGAFGYMKESEGALSGGLQTETLGVWEWRTDSIWFRGSTQSRDIRLRYIATYPNLVGAKLNFSTTYIPVLDCQDCVADKIAVRYTARLGGDSLQYAMQRAKDSLFALRQQMARNRQMIDYIRPPYGQRGAAQGVQNYLY